MSRDDDHTTKGLFTSPTLNLDLRYLSWSEDGCNDDPKVELKVHDIRERKMLGPAISADFELEEGQVVVFILRQVEEWGYANSEHQRVAQAEPERADTLGIPLDKLIEATSKLRPKQNPMLTKVGDTLVVGLKDSPSSLQSCAILSCTGRNGSGGAATREDGEKRCIGRLWCCESYTGWCDRH